MSGRCDTCEHWSRETIEDAFPDDLGTGGIPFKQRACLKVVDGACESWSDNTPAPSDEQLTKLADDLAFINVYEVWPNQLMTGPKFGCLHWTQDTRSTN